MARLVVQWPVQWCDQSSGQWSSCVFRLSGQWSISMSTGQCCSTSSGWRLICVSSGNSSVSVVVSPVAGLVVQWPVQWLVQWGAQSGCQWSSGQVRSSGRLTGKPSSKRPDWWSSSWSSGVSSAMAGGLVMCPDPVVSGPFEHPVASAVPP